MGADINTRDLYGRTIHLNRKNVEPYFSFQMEEYSCVLLCAIRIKQSTPD